MATEIYLKGEKRLLAKQIIKTGIGIRLRPDEMLDSLEKKRIKISERTLRRLKLEIYQESGETLKDTFFKKIGGSLVDDLLSYEEMKRNCWKMYYEAKDSNQQFKAMSLLQKAFLDNHKVIKDFPKHNFVQKFDYTKIKDDLAELAVEGDSQVKEN